MTGTIINAAAILIGGTAGIFLGNRFQEKVRQTVMAGVGLFTLAFGIQMFLTTKNALVVLGSILIGALLGEWWRVEDGLGRAGPVAGKALHAQSTGRKRR